MSVRTGVIGVGYLGRFHAQKYKDLSDLVGVFDVDKLRAKEVASELSVTAFDSVDELLDKVDAVSVVVNTKHHFTIAEKVLRASVHCLLEKPMTESVAQAKELIEKKGPSVLQIGHIERVNPAFVHIKNRNFKTLDFFRTTPFNQRGADVDVVLDLMIHDIDLCCELFGDEPTNITSRGQHIQSDSNDVVFAELEFAKGRICRLTAARCSQVPTRLIRGFGPDGLVEADLATAKVFTTQVGGELKSEEFERPDALKVEVEHFLSSISKGTPVLVSAEQGLRNLLIAHEIVDRID